MSSPRLFLSPFIFQFPPTKNFLPVMIADVFKDSTDRLCQVGSVTLWREQRPFSVLPLLISPPNSTSRKMSLVYWSTPAESLPYLKFLAKDGQRGTRESHWILNLEKVEFYQVKDVDCAREWKEVQSWRQFEAEMLLSACRSVGLLTCPAVYETFFTDFLKIFFWKMNWSNDFLHDLWCAPWWACPPSTQKAFR